MTILVAVSSLDVRDLTFSSSGLRLQVLAITETQTKPLDNSTFLLSLGNRHCFYIVEPE